jgi:calcium-dependent protein kinase
VFCNSISRLIKGGELFDELVKRKRFNECDAALIVEKVLSSISYCHEMNIIHRDLKPENILINFNRSNELDIKVIDFGASLFNDPSKFQNEKFGTVYYVAPEVLSGKYNNKCDVWSIGVILFILLCGIPPFNA